MNITNVDLRQLRYFLAVAEELNFTRAAERLHISQPPLSHQIQLLEASLNAKLFNRTKRMVALTEAGTYLVKAAGKLLREAQDAFLYTHASAQGMAGELRIGTNFSAPLHPDFPQLILDYRRSYPKVRLLFKEVFYEEGIKALANGDIDVCFTRLNDFPGKGRIAFKIFSHDVLELCLPAHHPLARKKNIAIEDLREELFLFSPRQVRTALYDELQKLAMRAGFYPRISQDTAHFPVIMNLVAAGYGVAFLPPFIKSMGHGRTVFKKLSGLKPSACSQPLAIAYCRNDESVLVKNFLMLRNA